MFFHQGSSTGTALCDIFPFHPPACLPSLTFPLEVACAYLFVLLWLMISLLNQLLLMPAQGAPSRSIDERQPKKSDFPQHCPQREWNKTVGGMLFKHTLYCGIEFLMELNHKVHDHRRFYKCHAECVCSCSWEVRKVFAWYLIRTHSFSQSELLVHVVSQTLVHSSLLLSWKGLQTEETFSSLYTKIG